MRFVLFVLLFFATLLQPVLGQATASSDNASVAPVGVRVYDDMRLPIGTPIWANTSDGVYGQCTTHRVPTARVPYAPEVRPACFYSNGIDPEHERFSRAYVTGYRYDYDSYGNKKVFVYRIFVYRITWVYPDGITLDRFVPATLVFKMINISDWRTEYSQFIALVNW